MGNPPPAKRMMQVNERNEIPQLIAFLDTETREFPTNEKNKFSNQLHFGICEVWGYSKRTDKYNLHDSLTFTTTVELADFLDENTPKRKKLVVFAHNMGGFDFMSSGMKSLFELYGWDCIKSIMGCPPFALDIRKENRTISLRDSLNYYATSIENLGKLHGYPKGKDPGMWASVEERKPYCQRDVDILRISVLEYLKFLKTNDLGNFQYTIAGQSMSAFRHRFMSTPLLIDHRPEIVKVEREAYMGGLTMTRFLGVTEGARAADKTSMYPSVMKAHDYPVQLLRQARFMAVKTLKNEILDKGFGAICKVRVRTSVPCLPVRDGGRLIMPTGTFETTLSTPELQLAFELGEVLKVVGPVNVYKMAPIFGAYVDFFTTKRLQYIKEGNQVWADLCKMFQNSLYGKFGQKTPEFRKLDANEETYGIQPGQELSIGWGKGVKRLRCIASYVEVAVPEEDRGESVYAMCAIAAHVTAWGRVTLNREALLVDPNWIQCDTDSVFTSSSFDFLGDLLAKRNPNGIGFVKELGNWAPEYEYVTHHSRGPKDYAVKFHAGISEKKGKLVDVDCELVKIKGVRRAGEAVTQEQYNSMSQDEQLGKTIKLDDNTYVVTQFQSSKVGMFKGSNGVTTRRVTKRLTREYKKGIVQPDGWVRPFVFDVVDGQNVKVA